MQYVLHRLRLAGILLLALLSLSSIAAAQLPITELTAIYPPGGKQGTQVEVDITGNNLDGVDHLRFSHPGITAVVRTRPAGEFDEAPQPIPGGFTVKIADDVPPGMYEARAGGRFGLSNPRRFTVDRFDEVVDDGTNKLLTEAQQIDIPLVINGRLDSRSSNHYIFPLEAGEQLLVECLAQQLDSRLHASLVLLDSSGRELCRAGGGIADDPLLDFTAPSQAEYVLRIHDVIYRGGAEYFYRLRISGRPHLEFALPPAVPAGTTASVTLYGRNLPEGRVVKEMTVEGRPMEAREVTVSLPTDLALLPRRPDRCLSLSMSLLDGIFYQLQNSNPLLIHAAQAPVVMEQEENDSPQDAQSLSIPSECAGQFFPARDRDWYQFETTQAAEYVIELVAHRLGSDVDPAVLVQKISSDGTGQEKVVEIARVDDAKDRERRMSHPFDASSDDPVYRLAADEDAAYRIMVRDNFGGNRSDPRRVYRLIVRHPQPDFRLLAVPELIKPGNQNEVLQCAPVLRRGQAWPLKVIIERRDGFAAPIEISTEGLPPGVHCTPVVAGPSMDAVWLVFHAAMDAPAGSAAIGVVGRAQHDGHEIQRTARPATLVWGTNNQQQQPAEYRATEDLVLSVIEAEVSPALIKPADEQAVWDISVGGKVEIPITVERHEGFQEPLKLLANGLPGEIKQGELTIAADASQGTLLLEIGNVEPGFYTFVMRADTKMQYVRNLDAVTAAEKEHQRLTAVVQQLKEELQQKTMANGEAAEALKEMTEKANRAEEARKTAEQRLAEVKKANEPKEVNFTLISLPIRLRVQK